ncbi:YceO family protein [Pseudescherichia sp.]|nr:YceO family protein [Pseudescherichia sp.]
MRRLFTWLTENVREHLMAYIAIWSLLALIDLIYIIYAG